MAKRPSLAANVKAAAGEPSILPVPRMTEATQAERATPSEAKRSAR